MLHDSALKSSFDNSFKIRSVFKEILGLDGIEHFSLDLVDPQGRMLFFSSTPSHAYVIFQRGLGDYDGIISSQYYENFEFYWWSDAHHKSFAQQIQDIREGVLSLKHGFMLVRKWNNFHLIYSFAAKKQNTRFQSLVVNDINKYLKMGDYAYMEMLETYSIYTGSPPPPKIEKFYFFDDCAPPSRYTHDFIIENKPVIVENKIIQISSYNKWKK
ncbi:MAG: hypothetical protein HKM04_07105 [Legionellales bacterium]|nr:hypothetical protein [Legionellales bacterium]